MSNSIHISELSKEISNVVKSYSKEVELEAGEATELVAKETVQELKRSSPTRNWTKRKQGPTGQIVFQKDPTYRLTHLLENGHALKRGGRTIGKVKGQPHIAIAEEKAVSSLEKELIRRLK